MKKTIIIMLLLPLLFLGCSKKKSTAPTKTAKEAADQGWVNFEAGNWTTALTGFNEALGIDAGYADAHLGKGLCLGIQGNAAGAVSALKTGLSNASGNLHIKAGLAFAYLATDSNNGAAVAAGEVLTANATWRLPHSYKASVNDTLDYRDLRVLKAEAYFRLGQFAAALAEIQHLNAGFTADPATFEGQAALMAEIERQSLIN